MIFLPAATSHMHIITNVMLSLFTFIDVPGYISVAFAQTHTEPPSTILLHFLIALISK